MIKNVAASVRARLANQAKTTERPFQEVLQHYGLERFLYRLAQSAHSDRFVLKGALMLRAWQTPESRPTRDIDLLGYVGNELPTLEQIARDVCSTLVEDDGVRFEASTVKSRRIKEDAEYEGVRVTFTGFLGTAKIPMQLDVGFGDVVHPAPQERDYPTMLEFPAPRLGMYPRETVVAEKFQAMVVLGTLNSRMKDFFDIWLLSRLFDFSGPILARSIAETFRHRGTAMDPAPVALTPAFTTNERSARQWVAFVKRSNLSGATPRTLDELREPLRRFLLPAAESIAEGTEFVREWQASGPWAPTDD
jgi:hypothetical protein